MFTGIVAGTFEVFQVLKQGQSLEVSIQVPQSFTKKLELGASVAVNGVCLTLTKTHENFDKKISLFFDIIPETYQKTNLSKLVEGDFVNLERSLKFGGEVGGHILTGHVSDQAKILKTYKTESHAVFYFSLEPKWLCFLIEKTHIAIDGISLTLVDIFTQNKGELSFSVHLIPETLRQTSLGLKTTGDLVNIEFNQTIKTIVETTKRILSA